MKHFSIVILLIVSQLRVFGQDLNLPNADFEIYQLADFRAWELIPVDVRQDYIKKYRKLAIDEMIRSGVPASISMAQGIVESNAGQSKLATEAHNHFGIKCGATWKGKSYFSLDDDRDAAGNAIQSCFRKYKHADDSWIDHSDFLRDPKKYNRYGFLFHLDPKDYRGWAYGLKSAGYATAASYAESIINVIETNKLYELDNEAIGGGNVASGGKPGKPSTTSPLPGRGVGAVNDVKVVLAKNGETLEDISRRVRVNTVKLVGYNDQAYQPTDRLKENSRVFIQKKRKKWRGRQKIAYIKDNQTLIDIAQQYGIRLDKLQKKNRLSAGEEPAAGETVKIRGWWKRASKPRLRSNDEVVRLENGRGLPNSGSNNTGNARPNGSATNAPRSTNPTETDAPAKNPYADELPFEIGDDRTATDSKPGSQPAPPVIAPKPLPTRPPIATTDSDFPGSERAKPTSQPDRPTSPNGGSRPTAEPTYPRPTSPATNPDEPARVPGGIYHEVVKGDTLYNLSKKYGTTPAAIQKLNNMADNNIKIGSTVRVK
jgi:LysM repeat protein